VKIVVAEKISAAGQKMLAQQPGWTVITPEQYAASPDVHLQDADALIVRSAVEANRSLIERAPKLRVIGRAGVGVDNVDVPFATERGIVVMNTPGANAVAVAEHTLALMLSLARHIPRADQSTRAGKWEKKSLQGSELRGKVLGIVGLGRIGIELSRRATALAMTVIAFDPYVSQNVAEDLGVRMVPLDELYQLSDYLSLHVGLTPQTQGMINAESIAKMKPGIRIVNCARGELLDESALAAALQSGTVAALALDVFAQEPPKNNPLFALPNVVATPHIAGSTVEAQDAVGVQIAQQITDYLRDSVAQNAVNVPSLTDAEYRQMRPYLELAEKLASLLAQLIEGNLNEVRLSYAGALTRWKTALLRSYAIIGVLQGRSQETINVVNAEAHAKQRGFRISEAEEGSGAPDLNLLSITLRSERSSVSGTGTVVHGNSARVIELNGTAIEAPLAGSMLVVRNRDVPGVIGKLGSVLGESGINIAHIALGREAIEARAAGAPPTSGDSQQRNALGVIQTDVPVPATTVEALIALPEVVSVKVVRL